MQEEPDLLLLSTKKTSILSNGITPITLLVEVIDSRIGIRLSMTSITSVTCAVLY